MYSIRVAKLSDQEPIECLIRQSVRGLAAADYSTEQIDGVLAGAWGVDTQLLEDETYFVVESEGIIVACGGWSYRQTLFGSDAEIERDAAVADPDSGTAKIRAFFVHPDHARRGIGTMLMRECEAKAIEHGFTTFELLATLPGKRLYEQHGFQAGPPIQYDLGRGLSIAFVPMTKRVDRGQRS